MTLAVLGRMGSEVEGVASDICAAWGDQSCDAVQMQLQVRYHGMEEVTK